jgi:hypothetical protein
MSNEYVLALHLVKVFPDSADLGGPFQIWAAATSADKAVESVLKRFPPGRRAERLVDPVTKALAGRLKLRAGGVCDVSSGR